MSCGLSYPLVSRWVELPGDPAPLRRELAAKRGEEEPGPAEDHEEEPK